MGRHTVGQPGLDNGAFASQSFPRTVSSVSLLSRWYNVFHTFTQPVVAPLDSLSHRFPRLTRDSVSSMPSYRVRQIELHLSPVNCFSSHPRATSDNSSSFG